METLRLHSITKAAYIAALVMLTFFFAKCQNKASNRVQAVQLTVNYPFVQVVDSTINYFNLQDTVTIMYFNKYVICRLPSKRDLATNKKITGTQTYFIYRDKSKPGYWVNSLRDDYSAKKLATDSFLNQRAFGSLSFDATGTLIDHKNTGSGELFERYVLPQTDDVNSFDSIYYYYTSNLKNVPYSFAKNLDSSKGMKLYKARLLYNEKFSSTYRLMFPKREYRFEIKEVNLPDERQIIDFMEKFIATHLL